MSNKEMDKKFEYAKRIGSIPTSASVKSPQPMPNEKGQTHSKLRIFCVEEA
jgi:hypothetical protein